MCYMVCFFFSSRRRHTRWPRDWSSDVCSSDLHLWGLARKLYPNEEVNQKAWMKVHQKRLLDKGKIEKLVDALRSIATDNSEVAEKIRTEAEYFERNAERIRYHKYRRQH